MSGIQETLLSRRTVYRFKEDKVDNSFLDLAFNAAAHAPNHKNTNPWRTMCLGKAREVCFYPR